MATKTAVVSLTRDEAIAFIKWLGFSKAADWSDERLESKLNRCKDILEAKDESPDPDEIELVDIYDRVVEGFVDDASFVVGEAESFADSEVEEQDVVEEETDTDDELDGVSDELAAESDHKSKKDKRGRPKKEKKEIEQEKEIDLEEVFARYRRDEPEFEFVAGLTPEQAKEMLQANTANRPFRKGISTRYAEEIIRKKWFATLEPIIFDKTGSLVSGQHRLQALIQAQLMLDKDKKGHYQSEYNWNGNVTMPTAVAYGADPKGNDSQDLGQKRTGGDVLFRRSEFGDRYKESDLRKLSNDLSVATRLCWILTGQKTVSDAPHFPHSEMIDFIERHPKLKQMVEFVYSEDAKEDEEGNKRRGRISSHLTRGYMAALAYLFGVSATEETDELNFDNWTKAEEFVTLFAAGLFDSEDHPIYQLRQWLARKNADKINKVTRDARVSMVINAWRAFQGDEKASLKRVPKNVPEIGGIA